MLLHLRYPTGTRDRAEELWEALQRVGCPLDLEKTLFPIAPRLMARKLESHVRLDENGKPTHCIIRLSTAVIQGASGRCIEHRAP